MSKQIQRRAWCGGLLGVGGALCGAQLALGGERRRPTGLIRTPRLSNADFYTAGKFNPEAAKSAYLVLMDQLGYPHSPELAKTLFVTDFGLGQFLDVGLGIQMWVNDQKANYTSLDMCLLPNQMIPEHWHVAVEAEKIPAKMESWLVRYGVSYTYGEGPATSKIGVTIHESQKPFVTVLHETRLGVGQVTGISKPLEKHWQQAGPEGAVVSEFSTYHSGAAVRFTDPKIKF